MVNKAIVGILVLVVLTSLGVGVLIGTQLGGDGGSDAPADGSNGDGGSSDGGDGEATETAVNETATNGTATNGTATNRTATNGTATNGTATSTDSPTASPTPTQAQTQTASATQTATPTATPTPTPIPGYAFDSETIENEMIEEINDERENRGLYRYETGTLTYENVRDMAREHSQVMAEENEVRFEIGGNSTEERYRRADLYDRCKYQDPEGGFIVQPDNSFQAVGRTVAGRTFQDEGEERRYTNESQVAQDIVEDWFESSTYRRPLVNDGVDIIAVGVTVTDDGRVFAAAAICS